MPEESVNRLYYGDNLDILKRYIPDESVDLVYLDPPFNSNANYNVLFTEKDGTRAASQIQAFTDTWTWGQEDEAVFAELVISGGKVAAVLQAFRTFLGPCDLLAYLVMMAPRLVELRRVMKSTGSLYLHCDPTASHYLKLLMDAVFGSDSYQNEIIWQKIRSSKGQTQGFGAVHDIIFAYRKTDAAFFNRLYVPLDQHRIEQHYSQVEQGTGRRYMLDNFTQAGAGEARRFDNRMLEHRRANIGYGRKSELTSPWPKVG
jgi:adenine specific DNA methylase Mod